MACNEEQHKMGRLRDEGGMSKGMRKDTSMPTVGAEGRAMHGRHTGEVMMPGMPKTARQMGGMKAPHAESMMTPAQGSGPKMKKGMPGRHQEDK